MPRRGTAYQAKQAAHKVNKEFKELFEAPVLRGYEVPTPEAIQLQLGAQPPNRPTMRLSPKESQESEKMLKEALDKGWIQTSTSAYGTPVLFVPKSDCSVWMCVVYRALNKLTVKNCQNTDINQLR
jgi:hypothetical protein